MDDEGRMRVRGKFEYWLRGDDEGDSLLWGVWCVVCWGVGCREEEMRGKG